MQNQGPKSDVYAQQCLTLLKENTKLKKRMETVEIWKQQFGKSKYNEYFEGLVLNRSVYIKLGYQKTILMLEVLEF